MLCLLLLLQKKRAKRFFGQEKKRAKKLENTQFFQKIMLALLQCVAYTKRVKW